MKQKHFAGHVMEIKVQYRSSDMNDIDKIYRVEVELENR